MSAPAARLARPRPAAETPRWNAARERRRAERWSRLHEAADRVHFRISMARLALAAATIAGLVASWRWPSSHPSSPVVAAVAALAFVATVAVHRRTAARRLRLRGRQAVAQREALRAAGRWREAGRDGAELAAGSTIADDLQLVGPGSLFQAVSRCVTSQGERALADALAAGRPSQRLRDRAAAVRELASRRPFREELQAEGILSEEDRGDPSRVAEVMLAPSWHDGRTWVGPVAAVSVALTLAQALVATATGAPTLVWPFLAAQSLVAAALARRLGRETEAVMRREREVLAWSSMLRAVERARLRTPEATRLRGVIAGGRERTASSELARLAAILDALAVRGSVLHPALAAVLLWDVVQTARLAAWRRRCGRAALAWLEALGELESLASLGAHAASLEEPCWPEVDDAAPPLHASSLAHPLIDPAVAVPNDLVLDAGSRVLLLSGSNMSGKSTLLRAAGCNAALALCGGAVHARALRMRPCALATSVHVRDDLEQGVSLFYAEVLRLRLILDAVDRADADPAELPALVLVDEVLRGTNTRERLVAGRSVVARLARSRSAAIVTSHDLALTALEGRVPGVANAHLREEIAGGRMTFDYRVRPGPVATTNALSILRLEGIDLEDPGGPS